MKDTTKEKISNFYDKNYKKILLIPILLLIVSVAYLVYFYNQNGDIMFKDSSLSGGTTITLIGNVSLEQIEPLKTNFPDISTRTITDLRTGNAISIIIETSASPEEISPEIEAIIGYELNSENSSIEFTGPSLSSSFYKQLIVAILISFILMSIVVLILFRTLIPSLAVIFSVLADILMPLALINFLGIKLSAAGIAAFLMLIGYSVDTDILLTTRALRKNIGNINSRLFGAFRTGSFMTLTALIAVLPAFFIVSALPDSFRQIFLILALGLIADLINTWMTNMSIIKWYCTKRRIE